MLHKITKLIPRPKKDSRISEYDEYVILEIMSEYHEYAGKHNHEVSNLEYFNLFITRLSKVDLQKRRGLVTRDEYYFNLRNELDAYIAISKNS